LISCAICHFDFSYAGLKEFDFIHHNKKHVRTKEFKKIPICEACKHGIFKDSIVEVCKK